MSSSGSGTVINYGSGSGSDFLTSYGSGYGSGSTSQTVTVPTVPVPVPQHWSNSSSLMTYFLFSGWSDQIPEAETPDLERGAEQQRRPPPANLP